jgi:putative transposase
MAHSFVCSYFHCAWSTHERRPLIRPDLKDRLWPYLAGIARQERMKALSVGGTDNHVHVLLSLPATMPVAKGVQLLKCNSSGWVNDELPAYRGFSWQEGYGAFSVSASAIERVTEYVRRQEEHHCKRTFEEEFLSLLKKHGVAYDPQRVFG